MKSGPILAAIRMLGPIAWLSFAAGLQMLGALLFFKAPIDFVLILTYALITFGIYMLNRFTDTEDAYNCPEQKMFFQKKSNSSIIPILLFIFSFLILSLTSRLVVWHVILISCGVLYSVSIIPFIKNQSLCFVRFKDILYVKNVIVSLLWGISPFAIVAAQHYSFSPNKTDIFIIVLAFSLTTLITAITYDVPDLFGDLHTGVKTFVTHFGEKFTAFFLLSLWIIGCLFVGIDYLLGNIGKSVTVLFFATMLWTSIVTIPVFIKKFHIPRSCIKPLLDSQCVFCGISLIFFSLLMH